MLRPADVCIPEVGMLTDTFGRSELEAAAAVLVRWHQANGFTEWRKVTRQELFDFLCSDPIASVWMRNPFWRSDPNGLRLGGWVDGWTDSVPGGFTELGLFDLVPGARQLRLRLEAEELARVSHERRLAEDERRLAEDAVFRLKLEPPEPLA